MWTVAVRPRSEFPTTKRGKFTMERLLPLTWSQTRYKIAALQLTILGVSICNS